MIADVVVNRDWTVVLCDESVTERLEVKICLEHVMSSHEHAYAKFKSNVEERYRSVHASSVSNYNVVVSLIHRHVNWDGGMQKKRRFEVLRI